MDSMFGMHVSYNLFDDETLTTPHAHDDVARSMSVVERDCLRSDSSESTVAAVASTAPRTTPNTRLLANNGLRSRLEEQLLAHHSNDTPRLAAVVVVVAVVGESRSLDGLGVVAVIVAATNVVVVAVAVATVARDNDKWPGQFDYFAHEHARADRQHRIALRARANTLRTEQRARRPPHKIASVARRRI